MARRNHSFPAAIALVCAGVVGGCDQPATVPPEATVGAEALPGYLRGLTSRDPAARARSAQAIGRMGAAAKEAVPGLMTALKDRDVSVRAAAAYSLGQIGPEARSALPELESLKRQSPLREVAAKAIEKIGP
jgi:HEAT repeat protein